jgi:1-acyl-sn-glycerol-3-phosphate acyltransferase
VWRILALLITVGVAVAVGIAVPVLPRAVRTRYLRLMASLLLTAVGIRVHVRAADIHARRAGSGGAGLIVANHISFLDILAIATVSPARFVAKAELTDWPVIGLLTRRLGVISIRRESLRDLPAVISDAVDGLRSGDNVGLFPEGTTRCGRGGGRFRPAIFQAAVETGVCVYPLVVSFHTADGAVSPAAAFIGTDDVADTMRRVLRAKGLTVRVRLCEPQMPGSDRRELADRCERVVFGEPPQIDLSPTVPAALVS